MKKCIVLDLDNTLWGGIVGEEGREGIALSQTAPGNAFVAFQQALLDHYHRGVILTLNSKNNPGEAWDVIRNHPDMILKEKHFAAVRLNWKDKTENIRELAWELNIGLDAMVFLDDDPVNRALMRSLVPQVETPDLPTDPAEYARFLHALPYFPADAITDEDVMRGNFYVTERLRKEAEKIHPGKEAFWGDLGLQLTVRENDISCLPRLAQLTEKTNQFNINKEPLSADAIRGYIESSSHTVFHARLTDRFGDYGIIGFAIAKTGNVWHIRALLISCRALGRGAEDAFVGTIMNRARESGATHVTLALRETEKNTPARDWAARHFPSGERAAKHPINIPSWIHTL